MLASPTLTGIAHGLAWFVAFLGGHIALFRLCEVRKRFAAIVRVLLGAMSACLLSMAPLGELSPLSALAAVMVMAGQWVVYVPFYYVVATSTSVRVLIELRRAGGSWEVKELEARFASVDVVRQRMETMIAYGHLARQGGAFVLTPKGRRTARLFAAIKRLWRLGAGG